MEEWIYFAELEPWGDEWRQNARLEGAIWNSQLAPDDRIDYEIFMPLPEEAKEEQPQTKDELSAIFAGRGVLITQV